MASLPFPSRSTSPSSSPQTASVTSIEPPWEAIKAHDPPQMMFQIQFADGRWAMFTYSDLREVRRRDAGHLTLGLVGMEKMHITIEGRNLDDLVRLLSIQRIKSIAENGRSAFDRPENAPAIDRITIEELTGPSLLSIAPPAN